MGRRRSGDKGAAICAIDGRVTTTYRHRDVPMSESDGIAMGILVGVCDICGGVIAIPTQSVASIRSALILSGE